MNNVTDKLVSTAITVVGGYLGTKVVEFAWRKVTGHDAPKDINDTEANMWSAVTFAAIAAGITALIRVLSQRGAASATKALQARSKTKAGSAEV